MKLSAWALLDNTGHDLIGIAAFVLVRSRSISNFALVKILNAQRSVGYNRVRIATAQKTC